MTEQRMGGGERSYCTSHLSRKEKGRQSPGKITYSFYRNKNSQEKIHIYLKKYTSVGLFLYPIILIDKLKSREFKTMLETSAYF